MTCEPPGRLVRPVIELGNGQVDAFFCRRANVWLAVYDARNGLDRYAGALGYIEYGRICHSCRSALWMMDVGGAAFRPRLLSLMQ